MTELDALLAGIVADPREETRWLVLADYLDEHDDPRRGELLRLHRKLIATCCEPDAHPERADWQARMVELLVSGVRPCVPQETLTLPGGVPLTLSFIPPGAFLMGSDHPDGNDDERPAHRVEVEHGFFLGIYPVTQAQWSAVMGTDPSHFKSPNRPVENVSWDECQDFCAKLSRLIGRRVELPTEAEWEYGCRAGTVTEFYFGDVLNTDLANYAAHYSWNGSPQGEYREGTTDVGSFPANPWGLYDVHGNVDEFCTDTNIDQVASKTADRDMRALRGGCWHSEPLCCRAAGRCWESFDYRNYGYGFRLRLS